MRVLRIAIAKEVDNTTRARLFEFYKGSKNIHKGDCGVDLVNPTKAIMKKGDFLLYGLGIHCEVVEEGTKNIPWMLVPRSSIVKTKFRQANSIGIIDAGYRGEVKAPIDCISNLGNATIEQGERYFQLVCPDMVAPDKVEVVLLTSLSNTSRGSGGFGSTGK